jgi:hypothetical protein
MRPPSSQSDCRRHCPELGPLQAEEGEVEKLWPREDAGDREAVLTLVDRLCEQKDIKGLEELADSGSWYAAHRLALLLVDKDDIERLRRRVDAGGDEADLTLVLWDALVRDDPDQ